MRHTRDTMWFIFVTLACALFVSFPYFFGNFLLPRTEELNYSLYPLIVWSKQVMQLHAPYWYGAAGLGIPWPVPHTMSHTPYLPLFATVPVYTAVGIMVVCQMCFQSVFIIKLCRYFALSRLMTYVVLVSLLIGVPIEQLQRFDAMAIYMLWTLMPATIYYIFQLMQPGATRQRLLFCTLALGLLVGYAIVNTHIGVMLGHIVAYGVLAAVFWKRSLPRTGWFVAAALIALVMGADKIVMLLAETPLFGNLPHIQDGMGRRPAFVLWSLLLKPILIPNVFLYPTFYMGRTLTFGCFVFGWIFVIACLRWRALGRQWSDAPRMVLACVLILLLSHTPIRYLPDPFSSSYSLRDPLLILSIIVIARYCDTLLAPRIPALLYRLLLVVQMAGLLVSASYFVYSGVPTYAPKSYPRALYDRLSNDKPDALVDQLLNLAMRCPEGRDCSQLGRRYVMSARAMHEAQTKMHADNGLIVNNGMLRGFENVSFLAKGLSLDSIQRSQSYPYGLITGEAFMGFRLMEVARDWTVDNKPLLDLLGIRAVIGPDTRAPANTTLVKIGNFPRPDKKAYPLAVYANPDAFPRAFFIPADASAPLVRKPWCFSDGLICRQLDGFVATINPWKDPIRYESRDDAITLHVTPAEHARTALISVMWRPGWHTQSQGSVQNLWGLMKVEVPPHAQHITLRYRPSLQIAARWITLLAMAATLIALVRIRRKI